jgi:hypothetical protein
MLEVNGTTYGLCLLDTNAVSEMLKNRKPAFRNFLSWALREGGPTFIPSFFIFTTLELRQSPTVYEQFTDVFSTVPCLFLKSREMILEDEVRLYPNPTTVDPSLLGFAGPLAQASLADVLESFFATDEGIRQEQAWYEGRRDAVKGMVSLVQNYRPARGAYTPTEVRTFIQIVGYDQIAMMEPDFARSLIERGEALEIDAFPSIKASTFTVFYKFYVDRSRRPQVSDAFDVLISSATPYMDAIVTENHQPQAIRKMKRRDAFLDELRVFTLKDFRGEQPPTD